jgi:2-hydroxychromene-2-carboxylate isomerase
MSSLESEVESAAEAVRRLRGSHPLVIYIDLKSPYAYLAIDPSRAMARALGVPIDWRPFTLDIPSYLGSAKLDAKGSIAKSERSPQQWSGVRYAYMDARRYANLTGKTVRGTVKIWDSSLAGIAMLWAKRHACLDRFLDGAYPRFWRRDLDIEDPEVLEAVLVDADVPAAGFLDFAKGEGRAEHDELNEAAFEAGVFGVPTYLVGDEKWFGREHLPRVSWLLGGGNGLAPEVANRSFGVARRVGATDREGATEEAVSDRAEPASLTILLDIRNPGSCLALAPAAAFAEELSIEVDWLPVRVPALKPPSAPSPDDDRGILHRRHRARSIAQEFEIYGRLQDLALRDLYRDGDTTAFEFGWLWLRQSKPERLQAFIREGFRRYWSTDFEPGRIAEVVSLFDAIDVDAGSFASWSETTGPRVRAEVDALLNERGAVGAPGYLVEDELFLGRQHLPMIRWILEGRKGHGPI